MDMDDNNAVIVEQDFAQIEHINQIIYDNLHFDGWECFDTSLLLAEYPEYGVYDEETPSNSRITSNVVDVRYNSLIVNISIEDDHYLYSFEVRNALWNGEYKITHSKTDNSNDDVLFTENTVDINSPDDTNILEVRVYDDDRDDIRVCFHMQMDGEGRTILESSLSISNDDVYEDQYDESVKHSGYVYDETGQGASNVTVYMQPCDQHGLILEEGVPSESTITDSSGCFTLPYGAVSTPGVYYVLLTAERNSLTATKIVEVDKVQNNRISHLWGVESEYSVYKGSIKEYALQFVVLDKYGQQSSSTTELKGIPVNVTMTKVTGGTETQTCNIDSSGYIHPVVSYRGYYEETSTLQVNVPSTDLFPDTYTSKRTVKHPWYIADTYKDSSSNVNDIVTVVDDDYGTDWIMLRPQTYKVTETLGIDRDLTLCGMTGENRVLLDGNNNTIIDITDEDACSEGVIKVNFYGLAFMNANCAIKISDGSDVTVDKCYFHGNDYNNTHNGVSIHQVSTDSTRKNSSLYKLLIQNSTFYNNVGNEILSIGTTQIYNNLFRTGNRNMDDTENDGYKYLKQPEPKVVAIPSGEVTYKYNKSFINAGTHVFSTNNTISKALCRVWNDGLFNGKGPSVLHENDTLPLWDYGNEAFTYAIYYYPNDKYKSELVCSPAKGNERRATGHRAEGVQWTFWDGYYFVRWNKGKNLGNTSAVEKWSNSELEVPGNQGVYNEDERYFPDKSYDPRVSTVIH